MAKKEGYIILLSREFLEKFSRNLLYNTIVTCKMHGKYYIHMYI